VWVSGIVCARYAIGPSRMAYEALTQELKIMRKREILLDEIKQYAGMGVLLRLGRSIFAVCLLTLLAVGCGRRQDDGKAHLVLSVPADQKTRAMYRGVITSFEARYPHVKIQILEIPAKYYGKVLVMIAGNNAPDLMWMGQSFAEFAVRGVFLDLSAKIKQEVNLDEYLPQALEWYRIDGKQYGIPFGVDMSYIIYNKALFDQAGVPYPTDDWTFPEFLERAQKLTFDRDGDGNIDQYGFAGSLEKSTFGAAVMSKDGNKPLCNSPEMIDCLQTNLDLAEKWKVSPRPDDTDMQSLDLYAYFRQGKAAMMLMYTWNLPFLSSRCDDMKWDIVNNPKVRQRGHWASSQAILVSADTAYPEESWLLCKEFFSDEIQRTMSARGLPPNLRVAREIIKEYARTGKQPANIAALYKARDSLYPTPRIANLSEIMSLYGNAASGVSAHRATPQEAMIKAEKAINVFLKRRQRNRH